MNLNTITIAEDFTSVRHKRKDNKPPYKITSAARWKRFAERKRVARQGDVPGRAPRRARVARDTVFDKSQPPEATSRLHPDYQWPTTKIVAESLFWYKYDFKSCWCTSVEAAYWRHFIVSEDMMDNQGVRWVTWKRTWQTKKWASVGLVEEWVDEQAAWETITLE
ncbi:hypothetical protein P7C70_g7293, partial [Phenoliferia sp. Uapishka_3]